MKLGCQASSRLHTHSSSSFRFQNDQKETPKKLFLLVVLVLFLVLLIVLQRWEVQEEEEQSQEEQGQEEEGQVEETEEEGKEKEGEAEEEEAEGGGAAVQPTGREASTLPGHVADRWGRSGARPWWDINRKHMAPYVIIWRVHQSEWVWMIE